MGHSILPYDHDRDTAGFFEPPREGRLVYRACNDCDHALHPPTDHCPTAEAGTPPGATPADRDRCTPGRR
jgi:uncharacterized OB-fold protein